MSATKQGYSPRSVQGVNFFHHFPRQRLRPYGEIKETTANSTMLEKASILHCKYLLRPAVALSKMADTISANNSLLKEKLRAMDENKIIRQVEKMNNIVKMFNTKLELPITNSDVHRLLKYDITDEEDESDQRFDDMEQ